MSPLVTRPRALTFAALITGGGVAVVSAAQPWWRAVGQNVLVRFSGVEATGGLAQALAVVALAGTLLILVLRRRGRRIVGVILVLVGAGIAAVGAIRQRPNADAVRTQVREISLVDQFAVDPTGWSWAFAVAGALVALGGALAVVTAPRWPGRADRFERTVGTARPVVATDDAAEVWRAMDAGMDPTLDTADPDVPDPGVPDPDVHDGPAPDTMAMGERLPPSRPLE